MTTFFPAFSKPKFIYPKLPTYRDLLLFLGLGCIKVRWVALWKSVKGQRDCEKQVSLEKKLKKFHSSHEVENLASCDEAMHGLSFYPHCALPLLPQDRLGKNWMADFISIKLHYWKASDREGRIIVLICPVIYQTICSSMCIGPSFPTTLCSGGHAGAHSWPVNLHVFSSTPTPLPRLTLCIHYFIYFILLYSIFFYLHKSP